MWHHILLTHPVWMHCPQRHHASRHISLWHLRNKEKMPPHICDRYHMRVKFQFPVSNLFLFLSKQALSLMPFNWLSVSPGLLAVSLITQKTRSSHFISTNYSIFLSLSRTYLPEWSRTQRRQLMAPMKRWGWGTANPKPHVNSAVLGWFIHSFVMAKSVKKLYF